MKIVEYHYHSAYIHPLADPKKHEQLFDPNLISMIISDPLITFLRFLLRVVLLPA